MSRPHADFVREDPPVQPFDLLGLLAGVLFAFAGLAYLFGGRHALSGSSSLVLPTLLVLLGLAGLAGSGLVRRSWFSRSPHPAATESPADSPVADEDAAPPDLG